MPIVPRRAAPVAPAPARRRWRGTSSRHPRRAARHGAAADVRVVEPVGGTRARRVSRAAACRSVAPPANADVVHAHGDMASVLMCGVLRGHPSLWTTHGMSFLRRTDGARHDLFARRLRAVVAATQVTVCTTDAERQELLALRGARARRPAAGRAERDRAVPAGDRRPPRGDAPRTRPHAGDDRRALRRAPGRGQGRARRDRRHRRGAQQRRRPHVARRGRRSARGRAPRDRRRRRAPPRVPRRRRRAARQPPTSSSCRRGARDPRTRSSRPWVPDWPSSSATGAATRKRSATPASSSRAATSPRLADALGDLARATRPDAARWARPPGRVRRASSARSGSSPRWTRSTARCRTTASGSR